MPNEIVPAATVVSSCGGDHQMHLLHVPADFRTIEVPDNAWSALQWIQDRTSQMERLGEMGGGRWRTVCRNIDGITGPWHMMALNKYFIAYGVADNGQVRKLAELGRSDPLNVVSLSDYAFAVREEHLSVHAYSYQKTLVANLANTINAVSEANRSMAGSASVMIPLDTVDKAWFYNSAMSISRACIGREIFSFALILQAKGHLGRYSDQYKQMSGIGDDEFRKLTTFDQADYHPYSVLDLAVWANVMHRPIVLLEADDHEIEVSAFVPFLRQPDKCRDRRGAPRSPLVFTWANVEKTMKVALVAIALKDVVSPVYLPRKWFKRVWGYPMEKARDAMLVKYVTFDGRGNCLVASGEYFKPEHLREYVTAFNKFVAEDRGVDPVLYSEALIDIPMQPLERSQSMIMNLVAERRLWRCVSCWCLSVSETATEPMCTTCESKRHMRQQEGDGSIRYQDGDHTTTPAPTSWCFTKRKHFYGGREYDNPPQEIKMTFKVFDKTIVKSVWWFNGESVGSLNSNSYELAVDLVKSNVTRETEDFPALTAIINDVEREIRKQGLAAPSLDHQFNHLNESLAVIRFDDLFDDLFLQTWLVPQTTIFTSEPVAPEKVSPEAKRVIESISTLYQDIRQQHLDQLGVQANGKENDAARVMWETDEVLTEIEDGLFRNLEVALGAPDENQRWLILRSEPSLFEEGGIYYTYADRRHRKEKHFKLPLLGDRSFAFWTSKQTDAPSQQMIGLCVSGVGHFLIRPDMDLYSNMVPEGQRNSGCAYNEKWDK